MSRNARFSTLVLLAGLSVVGGSKPLAAQLGSRPAEEWAITLESGRRMESLEIQRVVDEIGLEAGDVVAEIGAGTGIFSVQLARAVLPGGRVLAVEVDEGFLPMIASKARQGNVDNVQPVLGQFEDPKLPRGDVDVAFFHDVLHHVADRGPYLQRTASYLAPGGRIAVVDYDMNLPGNPHRNQPEMLISPEQVDGWMRDAGLRLTRRVEMFPDKFYVIYTKQD
jgi:ubiquinone/menaquinone biosynthesis C-methylase UbiE